MNTYLDKREKATFPSKNVIRARPLVGCPWNGQFLLLDRNVVQSRTK